MPTPRRYHVGIAMPTQHVQHTIRRVPRSVDRALRRIAADRGMSLNAILLEAVTKLAGVAGESPEHTDLDEFIGSWISDPETDAALTDQRNVVSGDWT